MDDSKNLNEDTNSPDGANNQTNDPIQHGNADFLPNTDVAGPPGYHVVLARSGPLPTASELAAYNQVEPGTANRIITMTEKVVDAGIANDKYVLKSEYGLQWGSLVAFTLITLSCLGAGVYLTIHGHDVSGIGLLITGVATVIAAMGGRGQYLINRILGKTPPTDSDS